MPEQRWLRIVSSSHIGKGAELEAVTKRFRLLGMILLTLYLFLIGTHEGEFWPFSKFPMFSKTGRTWRRALVREIDGPVSSVVWDEVSEDQLPGRSFALGPYRINQDDLSAFLQSVHEGRFTDEQVTALKTIFRRTRRSKRLVLYVVRGTLGKHKHGVKISFRPLAVLDRDGLHARPEPSAG